MERNMNSMQAEVAKLTRVCSMSSCPLYLNPFPLQCRIVRDLPIRRLAIPTQPIPWSSRKDAATFANNGGSIFPNSIWGKPETQTSRCHRDLKYLWVSKFLHSSLRPVPQLLYTTSCLFPAMSQPHPPRYSTYQTSLGHETSCCLRVC